MEISCALLNLMCPPKPGVITSTQRKMNRHYLVSVFFRSFRGYQYLAGGYRTPRRDASADLTIGTVS